MIVAKNKKRAKTEPKPKQKYTKKKRKPYKRGGKRSHPKFGTSKLEQDFARDFLDKLGIEYVWQYEARDIKRTYDYYISKSNLIIEIDGDYWHSNPEKFDLNNLNPTQKKNRRVDKLKDEWAAIHGIPIMRIWENDIRTNPKEVMQRLKDRLYIESNKVILQEKKNERHSNKLIKNNNNE